MAAAHVAPSPNGTSVLLVEADSDARARHEGMLMAAGYIVIAIAACPDSDQLHGAAVVLSDIPSFDWVRAQPVRRLPPIVALADDAKPGVTACLCGAVAWVPIDSERAYLLEAVHEALIA